MIDILQAKKIVEKAYPDRNIIDDSIVQGNEYLFLTESKTNDGTEDFAGIGRWVDMETGKISEKNMFAEMGKDAELYKKIADLM